MHRLCFTLLALALFAASARADVDKNSAALVTELVTTSLGKDTRFDVLSSGDVRRQLEIEANKATLGCDAASTSCLAEIAGAMGASLVVYGKLGRLDDVVILTLNLFDSQSARAVGRVAVKERSLAAVSDRVDAAVQELIAPFTAKLAPTADASTAVAKVKLLVLDIEPPVVTDAPSAPQAPPAPLSTDGPSALFWGGIGGLVGGVVVGGAGVLFFSIAGDKEKAVGDSEVPAADAAKLYEDRDLFGGLGIAGVGLGVVGVGAGAILLGLSFTE